MHTILNPETITRRHELAAGYRSARFYPHIVINDFFTPEVCQGLVNEFPVFRDQDALNEYGKIGKKAYREDIRQLGGTYARLDEHVRSPEFLGLMGDITGIPDLLYDPDYIGGGTHDNVDGSELDIHVDFNYHPKRGWHRRLNLIVFLNPDWDESWGGAFELHKDPWEPATDEVEAVPPMLNRGVIFETSEISWHGFNKVHLPADKQHLSRRSFAIYLYSKDRPEEQIAPSHATFYIQRPLPERFQSGMTLAQNDVDQLSHLIIRRDQHMRYLYEREKEFSARIENLEQIIRQRLPIRGYVQQLGEAEGIWEDLWVGQTLTFGFKNERPIASLQIDGYVPDFFPSGRKLSTTIGELNFERDLDVGPFQWQLDLPLEAGTETQVSVECSATCNLHELGQSDDIRDLAFLLLGITTQ